MPEIELSNFVTSTLNIIDSLSPCIITASYCYTTVIYYLKSLGALQSVTFQRRGLFNTWTILSLITPVDGLIYPFPRLLAISFFLIKSLAFISFFNQPNLHSVKLFTVMHLSRPLMKLSGTSGKIQVII